MQFPNPKHARAVGFSGRCVSGRVPFAAPTLSPACLSTLAFGAKIADNSHAENQRKPNFYGLFGNIAHRRAVSAFFLGWCPRPTDSATVGHTADSGLTGSQGTQVTKVLHTPFYASLPSLESPAEEYRTSTSRWLLLLRLSWVTPCSCNSYRQRFISCLRLFTARFKPA